MFKILNIFVPTNIVMTSKQEDLNRQVVIALLKTGNHLNDKLNQLVKNYDLSLAQFNVLRILRGRNKVPASLGTINTRMIHKMSNTTRIIDKLIDKNLVERTVCKDNRRKIEIVITEKGLALLKNIDQPLIEKEADLVSNMTDSEKKQIIKTISNNI